jgi:hypothetical protein
MTGKEGIFSPGHMDDNPFKYSPHMQKERAAEAEHLHQINLRSSDNNLNVGQKSSIQTNVENPIYMIVKTSEG